MKGLHYKHAMSRKLPGTATTGRGLPARRRLRHRSSAAAAPNPANDRHGRIQALWESCLSKLHRTSSVPDDKSSSCKGFGLGPGIEERAPPMPASCLLQCLTLPLGSSGMRQGCICRTDEEFSGGLMRLSLSAQMGCFYQQQILSPRDPGVQLPRPQWRSDNRAVTRRHRHHNVPER